MTKTLNLNSGRLFGEESGTLISDPVPDQAITSNWVVFTQPFSLDIVPQLLG